MKSDSIKIFIGYIGISIIWGSTWLAIKFGLYSFTPFFSIGLRFFFASVLIFIIMKFRGMTLQIDFLSLKLYLALTFFSFVIPFGLVYWAEQFIDTGLASILFAVYPFFIIIFSYLFLPDEKIGMLKIIGVTLGFVGIIIIFFEDFNIDFSNDLVGMLFVMLSAVLQASIAVLIKKCGQHLNPITMNFLPLLSSGIILLFVGYFLEDRSYWKFDFNGILSVSYLAIFGTVVAFTSYYWLLKRMNIVVLSMNALITPVVAIILGWIILFEKFSLFDIIGSCIVLIGILFVNLQGLKNYYKQKRVAINGKYN
ncbi:MAG: EamA family transporter [Ignavibacteriales bacterium]|nr:EamA family transporter [Ignavibacteriales bacterium]